jgi:hypothetical protein
MAPMELFCLHAIFLLFLHKYYLIKFIDFLFKWTMQDLGGSYGCICFHLELPDTGISVLVLSISSSIPCCAYGYIKLFITLFYRKE